MASLRVGYCGRWQYGMLMDEAAGARQRGSGAEIRRVIDTRFETDRWGRLDYCRHYRRELAGHCWAVKLAANMATSAR